MARARIRTSAALAASPVSPMGAGTAMACTGPRRMTPIFHARVRRRQGRGYCSFLSSFSAWALIQGCSGAQRGSGVIETMALSCWMASTFIPSDL